MDESYQSLTHLVDTAVAVHTLNLTPEDLKVCEVCSNGSQEVCTNPSPRYQKLSLLHSFQTFLISSLWTEAASPDEHWTGRMGHNMVGRASTSVQNMWWIWFWCWCD